MEFEGINMKIKILGIGVIVLVALLVFSFLFMNFVKRGDSGKSIVGQYSYAITIGSSAQAAGTADYTCDGVDDDIQFQTALDAFPVGGGRLVVFAGTYNFSATVTRAISNVTIVGIGAGSYFTYDEGNPIFTAGGNNWVFSNIRTDAGGLKMGATTGWMWTNVTINTTHYAYRSPYGQSAFNDTAVASLTDSGSTSGRIPIAGAGGLLGDDADLTWSGGDTLTFTNMGATTLTGTIAGNAQAIDSISKLGIGMVAVNFIDATTSTSDMIVSFKTTAPAGDVSIILDCAPGDQHNYIDFKNDGNTIFTTGLIEADDLWSVSTSTNSADNVLYVSKAGVGYAGVVDRTAAQAANVLDLFRVSHLAAGLPGGSNGIGGAIVFYNEDSDNNVDEAGRIQAIFTNATHATQAGYVEITAMGAANGIKIYNSTAVGIGDSSLADPGTGVGLYIKKDQYDGGFIGQQVSVDVQYTSDPSTVSAYGGFFETSLGCSNSQNWTATHGLVGLYGLISNGGGSTGIITGSASFIAEAIISDDATFTNWYGFYAKNPTVAGSKLTNAYGVYIEAFTGAATTNYAFFSAGGNIHFAGLPIYADNAAAIAGGLVAGDLYRTNADPDTVCVVH